MKIRQNVLPVIAALIWGVAFVAQSVGADYVGAFTYNAVRFFIAAIALIPIIPLMRKLERSDDEESPDNKKDLIKGGIVCGVLIAAASNLQQIGISDTAAGKAGFLTALYIILVPLIGLFFGRKVSVRVWFCVILAIFGLYFLCVADSLSVGLPDVLLLSCSVIYAFHILAVDKYSANVNGVYLSLLQFVVAGIISAVFMLIFETPSLSALWQCRWSLLYVSVLSSGVGYTLQIIAQKGSNPTVVSLLLSLESVFSVLAGALILHETLSRREYLGCFLMLCAVFLVQIPLKRRKAA